MQVVHVARQRSLGKQQGSLFLLFYWTWMEANANDRNMKRYGYVVIASVPGVTCGTASQ
jgi:hypothetical protein